MNTIEPGFADLLRRKNLDPGKMAAKGTGYVTLFRKGYERDAMAQAEVMVTTAFEDDSLFAPEPRFPDVDTPENHERLIARAAVVRDRYRAGELAVVTSEGIHVPVLPFCHAKECNARVETAGEYCKRCAEEVPTLGKPRSIVALFVDAAIIGVVLGLGFMVAWGLAIRWGWLK